MSFKCFITRSEQSFYQKYGKRILDLAVSLLLLFILSPFLIIISLCVKFSTKASPLYKSTRVGKNGAFFFLYKFRTMVVKAENIKAELNDMNERAGPVFKIKNDPRVTLLGFFLRKLSIDELPQLWNVLNGSMSLVGPRPAIPEEVEKYSSVAKKRLEVKPGLTGFWQVTGRAALPFDEGVELDIYYIHNISFWFDLIILFKTIPAVILGRGAY